MEEGDIGQIITPDNRVLFAQKVYIFREHQLCYVEINMRLRYHKLDLCKILPLTDNRSLIPTEFYDIYKFDGTLGNRSGYELEFDSFGNMIDGRTSCMSKNVYFTFVKPSINIMLDMKYIVYTSDGTRHDILGDKLGYRPNGTLIFLETNIPCFLTPQVCNYSFEYDD
jgi:hypothetical protein